MIGVAVGCFADPDFGAPTVAIYDSLRHRWVRPVAGIPTHPRNGEDEVEGE